MTPTASGTTAILIAQLQDRNRYVRRRAVKGLAPQVATDLQVQAALVAVLAQDRAWRVQQAAAGALQPVAGTAAVLLALLAWLTTPATHADVRDAVIGVLAATATDPTVQAGLVPLLRHAFPDTRRYASQALTAVAAQPAVQAALRYAAQADPHPVAQRAAVWALAGCPDAAVLQLLSTLATDVAGTHPCVRRGAVDSLARQADNPQVQPVLLTALHDPDAWTRRGALWALAAQIAAPAVWPAAVACLTDADEDVQRTAVRILGPVAGTVPAVWQPD